MLDKTLGYILCSQSPGLFLAAAVLVIAYFAGRKKHRFKATLKLLLGIGERRAIGHPHAGRAGLPVPPRCSRAAIGEHAVGATGLPSAVALHAAAHQPARFDAVHQQAGSGQGAGGLVENGAAHGRPLCSSASSRALVAIASFARAKPSAFWH